MRKKWTGPLMAGIIVLLFVGLVWQHRELQVVKEQLQNDREKLEEVEVDRRTLQMEVDRLLAEQADLQEAYEQAIAPAEPGNPIDKCFSELFSEYGCSATNGWLYYLEGEAWEAELYHIAEQVKADLIYPADIQAVDDYLNAVEELVAARSGLSDVQEGDISISPDDPRGRLQWVGTGYSGRVSGAIASVYREAFLNFSDYGPWGYQYQFDADETKNKFLEGHY